MSKDILRDLRGFGTVEKWVLTDPKINIHAKAIYALLCAYAGGKDSAFPSVDTLVFQLSISKDTIYKYIKELREKGVIDVEQVRDGGRFSRNIYTLLNYNPNMISTESGSTGHGTTGADTTVSDQVDTKSNSDKSNSNKSNSDKEREANASLSSDDDAPTKVSVTEQIDLVVNAWNEISQQAGLSKVVAITKGSDRDTQLRARLKQFTVDDFIEAIQTIPFSPFLKGQNNRGWIITFNWFIKPSNFQKVLEGNYVGERRGVQNYASNTGGNQRKESTMDRARREQREFIERLNREPAQRANEDLGFHD